MRTPDPREAGRAAPGSCHGSGHGTSGADDSMGALERREANEGRMTMSAEAEVASTSGDHAEAAYTEGRPDEGRKNYTLWAEVVAVRSENDTLTQELATAHAANERLSLILSGMNDRLRAQLDALLARGLHTEERQQMFGQLKELLAYEEQFKQVQASHGPQPACPRPHQPTEGSLPPMPAGTATSGLGGGDLDGGGGGLGGGGGSSSYPYPCLGQPPLVPPGPSSPQRPPRSASDVAVRAIGVQAPSTPPPPSMQRTEGTSPMAAAACGASYRAENEAAEASASVLAALSEAAAEARVGQAQAKALAAAASKRAEAEIAEARMRAKQAVQEVEASASVLAALSEAAAEASAGQAQAKALAAAASKRAEAEIAEARMRAKQAIQDVEAQAEAAVQFERGRTQAAAAEARASEEELRRERVRGEAERRKHQAEYERWRAMLAAARADGERFRRTSALGELFPTVTTSPSAFAFVRNRSIALPGLVLPLAQWIPLPALNRLKRCSKRSRA